MSRRNRKRHTAGEWKYHWESWKKSGLTRAEYSRQHKLPIQIFQYWVTKYNKAKKETCTALVKLPAQCKPASVLELVIQGKYHLLIRSGFDSQHLQEVVQNLEKQACS